MTVHVGLNFGRSKHRRYQVLAICGPLVVMEESQTTMADENGDPLLTNSTFYLGDLDLVERVSGKPDVQTFDPWNVEADDRAIVASLVDLAESRLTINTPVA